MKVAVHDTNVPGALEVVALTTGGNGMIYGGYTGAKNHLFFEYDPRTGRYREVGPIVEESTGIAAARIHAMTVGHDGTLYAGETGATRSTYREKDGDIATGMHAYLYVIDA